MKWEKLGRLFTSKGQYPWMMTHASVPFAEWLEEDYFRLYFTPRDAKNRSYIGHIEIDLKEPSKILSLSHTPVLELGSQGHFDENGVMGSWLVSEGDTRYLYYIGWSLRQSVPFHTSIGLAVSYCHGPFHKVSNGPVLDRNVYNPYFVSTPCVIKEKNIWRMWYMSGLPWVFEKKPWAPYHIRYAESKDGLHWEPFKDVILDFQHKNEIAIARPCLIKDETYSMWYSYRGRDFPYRLGCAFSKDGLTWQRHDETIGLTTSSSGWDSEMICYPYVFHHKGYTYMLYAGNGFSQGGIGLAVMV